MEKRKLGQGLEVSAEGLGCMGMSAWYGETDEDEAIATIHRALDLGITFLDTADMYGARVRRERAARRRAIAARRDEVVARDEVRRTSSARTARAASTGGRSTSARRSRRRSARLDLEYVDLYYQHRVDKTVPIEETVGAMAELVAEGKVRHLGLSEASPDTIRRAHAVHPITALQTEYSLWTRDPEDEILATTRELGIGFVAYSPLGRGFLTGRFRSEDDFDDDDFRKHQPRFKGESFQRNWDLLERVQAARRREGRHARRSSRSPGCSRRATTSSRSPARSGARISRRTRPRRRSS